MGQEISRRQFLQLTAAATGATVLGAGLVGPLGQRRGTAEAIGAFEAYFDKSKDEHQANFDRLSGQGFRMVALSVYGDFVNQRYAAVWVQRQGPDWRAVHNVDGQDYQAFVDKAIADGYGPVLVSAAGALPNAVYAGVWEKGVPGPWKARHALTPADFDSENSSAAGANQFPRSVAIYGTPSDRRYAGVWQNMGNEYFRWFYHAGVPLSNYQQVFDDETKARQFRPAYVAVSEDQTYVAVFTDKSIASWVARHNMSPADCQAEFDKENSNGFFPIVLQGSGAFSDRTFAAIYAQQEEPTKWEILTDGTANRPSSLSGFDDQVTAFMRTNGIHYAQLTLAKSGDIKYAVAFTRREVVSNYQPAKVTDCFRLASCTKIFLEAAVQSLYDTDPNSSMHLKTDTKVYPLLGFSNPKDPRSDSITIQQLLDHTGGYDDTSAGSNFDPTFAMRQIATDLSLNRAVTKQDVMQYMYSRMLDYTPGSPPRGLSLVYSNYGYMLAGAVVEKVTGQKFFDYVNNTLLKPMGLTEVQMSPTAQSSKPSNEPPYEGQNYGPTALDPTSNLQVPAPYGGSGHILEVDDSAAGFAASATAIVKFIHLHKVWGNGARSDFKSSEFPVARKGSDPGALSYAWSRSDGVDWAVIFNNRDWPTDWDKTSDNFANSINGLLDKTSL
jgi:CubicO group peptidase (beta-lactamase class C family)